MWVVGAGEQHGSCRGAGEHVDAVWKVVSRTPSRAILSRAGVLISEPILSLER